MIALIVVSALLAITLVALCLSVALNLRLGKIILTVEDQVEESLDVLDENYQRIASIASMPVMSDEPFIREVLTSIKASRDAIMLVARKVIVLERTDPQESNDDSNTTDS